MEPDAALAAQNTDEASYGVALPTRGFHDLVERSTLGPLNHRDYFGLLVGTIRLRFAGCLLGLARFLCSLGFLGGFARALPLPGFRLTRVDVRSEWLNGFLHPACDWMGLFFCSRGNLSVMDKIFAQHADFGDLHLETRCIDDQWEWQVMAKGRGRIASDKAKSLEQAQEAAKNAAGAEEVEWRSVGPEVPPGPVA
jgi:hypothetical protein